MLLTKVKVLFFKMLRLSLKALKLAVSNPKALVPKIQRKLYAIVAARCELEVFYPNHVLIAGNHYPLIDLQKSDTLHSNEPLPTVVVIVPVYRNVAVTERCINSVLKAGLPQGTRLLIIEDKSPDPEMADFLVKNYGNREHVTVLHNAENLGFVKTVNRGMKWAEKADVVLLNSDTEVAGDWLERLRRQSFVNSKVSSVTATSNHATICSFPIMEERADWPLGFSTSDMQKNLGLHNSLRHVEIPTGVGFCMYITRASLDEVGLFDEEAFGKGYGEECDFCMRALKAGWKHLQALDVAVFHQGEVSFASTSNPSKARSEKIIHERYPDYPYLVSAYAGRDPGRAIRVGAMLHCLATHEKPVELIITHIHGGGVERCVRESVEQLSPERHLLILRQGSRTGRYRIYSADPLLNIDIEYSAKYAPSAFADICRIANVQKLHIHHAMDLDVEMLSQLKESTIPFDFYMHDYWTVCPQINLTTREGFYCGEPTPDICNKCISERPLRPLAPLPPGLSHDIVMWRKDYAWLFERANQVICPSRDVEKRARHYHPTGNFVVRYHEDQKVLLAQPLVVRPVINQAPMRIAILGAMAAHKGSSLILKVSEYAHSKQAPLEFFIAGTLDHSGESVRGINVLGAYKEEDLQAILTQHGIHMIWFPAGAPETYSYTLSHAMRMGYPIVAPKFGAFTERLAGRTMTWTYDIKASVSEVYDELIKVREALARS